jgi:hypothetical protein
MIRFGSSVAILLAALTVACTRGDRTMPEMATLKHIGEIHQAEERYHQASLRYGVLTELAETGSISHDLARGRKDGYYFQVTLTDHGYQIRARPIMWERDGRRSFFSDEGQQIHQSWVNRPANANDPLFR